MQSVLPYMKGTKARRSSSREEQPIAGRHRSGQKNVGGQEPCMAGDLSRPTRQVYAGAKGAVSLLLDVTLAM